MIVCAALTVAIFSTGCSKDQAVADKNKTEELATGTAIVASLQNTVDTGKNKTGDKVTLRTTQEVRVNEMTIVPAGATINGEVTHIDPAGRVAGGAELTLRFTELVLPDGKSYPTTAARAAGASSCPLPYFAAGAALGSSAGFTYVSENGPVPWTWIVVAVVAMA